ncbi:MAG: NUDIX domain-containing protein [Actinomycetota bacterium]|nr:NUDIX domain-containing protein [Actinomycetota bacterium]
MRDGRALITVRAREPEKGRLDLPGGFLEVGEHPVTGLVREVTEELGVEIEVAGNPILLATYTYGADGEYGLAIGFEARIVVGEPQPADDVAEVRWVSAEELDDLDFAWSHDRELVRAALAGGSV